MNPVLVRLRDRNQMTLPSEITKHLSLEPNALVEITVNAEDGHLELRRAEVVRAGTARAKREEEMSLKNVKEGRFTTFASPEELAAHFEATRANTEIAERVESLQQQVEQLAAFFKETAPKTVTVAKTVGKSGKIARRFLQKAR